VKLEQLSPICWLLSYPESFLFLASSCTSLPAPSGEKQKLLAETYSVFNESGRNFFFGTDVFNESGRNYTCWNLAFFFMNAAESSSLALRF